MANVNEPCSVAGFDLPAWCNALIEFWLADDAFDSVKTVMETWILSNLLFFFSTHRIDTQYRRNRDSDQWEQLPLELRDANEVLSHQDLIVPGERFYEILHGRAKLSTANQPSTAEHSWVQPSTAEHSGAQPRATLAHAHQQAWFDPSISITCASCILMLLSFNIFHPLIHCASCNPLIFFTCTCANVLLRLDFYNLLCSYASTWFIRISTCVWCHALISHTCTCTHINLRLDYTLSFFNACTWRYASTLCPSHVTKAKGEKIETNRQGVETKEQGGNKKGMNLNSKQKTEWDQSKGLQRKDNV